jgi:hypothetical protein
MSDDRPQHSGGFSGSISVPRAAIVLVAFVVAVAVLVAVGTRPTVSSPASSAQTTVPPASSTTSSVPGGSTTSTTAAAATTTTTTRAGHHHGGATTTSTVAHGTVSVVVANATNTTGLAAHFTTVLGGSGWNMKTPIDATTTESTSAVYYAAGMQPAASEIATSIGVKPAQVQPLTTSTPVSGVTGTDVVVVIGQDLAAATSGS